MEARVVWMEGVVAAVVCSGNLDLLQSANMEYSKLTITNNSIFVQDLLDAAAAHGDFIMVQWLMNYDFKQNSAAKCAVSRKP